MAIDLHTIAVSDSSDPLAQSDRLVLVLKKGVVSPVGSAAGAAVAVVLTGMRLPLSYVPVVTVNQDATHWITNRTQAGFTVNIAPRLAANTLAASTFDVAVFA